jgi:hypothetical protein
MLCPICGACDMEWGQEENEPSINDRLLLSFADEIEKAWSRLQDLRKARAETGGADAPR